MRTQSITVKLPVPVYEMLKDVKTKYKMTADQLFAELIEESYGQKKK
tara:strand:- start:3 stop:143 length:141 start_codon:yes stop_codon:yes gene_type:complete